MVSFVCNYCQATLKKPKLDQHAQRCYNATFSCIDCNTDFAGTDYRQHTACMTEEQKYKNKMVSKNAKPPAAKHVSSEASPPLPSPPMPKSTVEQLKERQELAAECPDCDSAPADATATKKRKHEKARDSVSAKEAKQDKKDKKRKDEKQGAASDWNDSSLPTKPVDALVGAITFVCASESPVSFEELKKTCVKMVAKHPQSKHSKPDLKAEFESSVMAALTGGKVTLTKC